MSKFEFYGLLERNPRSETVTVGIRTKRFGIYQATTDGHEVVPATNNEPNQLMFTSSEWAEIEKYALIVWRMIFETRAEKQRFEA